MSSLDLMFPSYNIPHRIQRSTVQALRNDRTSLPAMEDEDGAQQVHLARDKAQPIISARAVVSTMYETSKFVGKLRTLAQAAREAPPLAVLRRLSSNSLQASLTGEARKKERTSRSSVRDPQRSSARLQRKSQSTTPMRRSTRKSSVKKVKRVSLESTDACPSTPDVEGSADAEEPTLSTDQPEPIDCEAQRSAFWASREGRDVWSVPMARDLSQLPFLADGETGLDAALAHAHKLARTPLLIDGSGRGTVDAHYIQRAEVLDAKRMWQDEKTGARTHAQVMKEARKALVAAMRDGRPFVVSLTNAAPDFVTRYSSEDSLPLSIFDRGVVAQLSDFTGDGSLDLWESRLHPFAKLLRPNDLDMSGHFHVREGFQIIVTTQLDVSSFASRLALSVPLLKLQAIAPVLW